MGVRFGREVAAKGGVSAPHRGVPLLARRLALAAALAAGLSACAPLAPQGAGPGAAPIPAPAPLALADGDRILVLAPHPDDEVLGAGGVLQQAVARGLPVRVVFLTYGDGSERTLLGFPGRPALTPKAVLAMGERRREEALAAADALGVPRDRLAFLGYPDRGTLKIFTAHWGERPPYRGLLTRATAVPYASAVRPGAPFRGEEVLADLEAEIRDFRPTKVFVSHPADLHPDHAALYLFTAVALWDLAGEVDATVFPYLVHYPRWPERRGYRPGAPLLPPADLAALGRWWALPVDAEQAARKRRALEAHRSQFEHSAARLLAFVAADEAFGDLPAVELGTATVLPAGESATEPEENWEEPSGATAPNEVDLQGLQLRLDGDRLLATLEFAATPPPGVVAALTLCAYRRDRPFAALPKLEVEVGPPVRALDDGRPLPRGAVAVERRGRRIVVSLPRALLADPERLLVAARTTAGGAPLDRVPWRVVELPAAPGGR
jgi:LmbE family N-acetylglucosaminyl deacetylase